jgi:hypothetical protein
MANLSTFMAKYAADYIKGAALNDDFQTEAALDSYPFYLALALFTQGVNEKNLAKGIITGANDFEVRANANTRYVRKNLSGIWSNTFLPVNSGDSFPSGVQLPTAQKGYSMIYNTSEILWNDSPLVSWGTVTHFAILATQMVGWNPLTDPEGSVHPNHAYANPHTVDNTRYEYVLMWGKFATSKIINADDIFRFPIGSLQVNVY